MVNTGDTNTWVHEECMTKGRGEKELRNGVVMVKKTSPMTPDQRLLSRMNSTLRRKMAWRRSASILIEIATLGLPLDNEPTDLLDDLRPTTCPQVGTL